VATTCLPYIIAAGDARRGERGAIGREVAVALKLEVPYADRQEEAWKRVLMGGWSKRQIVETCGISEGVVSHMRRVKKRYYDGNRRASADKKFRKEIGNLMECSWWTANLAHRNATPQERTLEQKVQSLAKVLRNRLTDKLSEDPEVTAGALGAYDPDYNRTAICYPDLRGT
jgi:hypothetical protein